MRKIIFKKYKFKFKSKHIALLLYLSIISTSLFAQSNIINGVVRDAKDKSAIPGVNVYISNTKNGTVTDLNGRYSLNASKGDTLIFSFIGYDDEKIIVGEATTINVNLTSEFISLDDVIVIGYGQVKKKDLTTSVATVSSDKIANRPVGIISNALKGLATGVRVSSPDGSPGKEPVIRVRGITSINASNTPLVIIDGAPAGSLKDLNPENIESIQILKDASSQAIYGSRGAAGVIIVTTKQGKEGKPNVSFGYSFAMDNLIKKLDVLKRDDYLTLQNEALSNAGYPTIDPDEYPYNTDWQDETYKQGAKHNAYISISGGNDKNKYYTSIGYFKDEGIVDRSNYERLNIKINNDNQVSKRLLISSRLNISTNDWEGIKHGGGKPTGVIATAVIYPPIFPIYNEDGTYYHSPLTFLESPVAELYGSMNQGKGYNLNGTFYGELEILDYLKFRSTLSINGSYWERDYFLDPTITQWGISNNGQAYSETNFNSYYMIENRLQFNKNFKDIHNVSAVLVQSAEESKYKKLSGSATGYERGNIPYLSAGSEKTDANTYMSEQTLTSYIARISYSFKDKYLGTFNYRADGSSKFGPDNKYGYFPSASIGWRISNENFMSSFTFIYDMKLRASYGRVGKAPSSSYPWQAVYSPGYNYPLDGAIQTGYYIGGTLPNSALKWETTDQLDVGIDISLMSGKINFSADYFNKTTTDLLFKIPVPITTGFWRAWRNLPGEISNKGFEFTLNTKNINKSLRWLTDINLTLDKNKVESLAGLDPIETGLFQENIGAYTSIIMEGESLGAFYGYVTQGVDPETGKMIFKDLNNDGEISPEEDRTVIGNPNPDFYGSIGNTFRFKGLELYLLLEGSYGNDIFNATRFNLFSAYDISNMSVDALSRWQKPGDITDIPQLITNDPYKNFRASSFYIEDGSYLRIKNITLSYYLNPDWIKKIFVKSLKVYASLENIKTFSKYSGYDPEVSWAGGSGTAQGIDYFNYPQIKTVSFGVNVQF